MYEYTQPQPRIHLYICVRLCVCITIFPAFDYSVCGISMEFGYELRGLIILMVGLVSSTCMFRVFGEAQVPCYFIFGDSLFDNGNNNALSTMAKANYPPYGIDFPKGSTGRFTSGRNTGDILGICLFYYIYG